MRKRTSKTVLLYGKGETTSWLSWLARNMREDGHTTFFMERLEPSWLPTRRQQWVYILVSRLVEGVLIGLIGGFIVAVLLGVKEHVASSQEMKAIDTINLICHGFLAGVVGGFATGLADCLRLREMGLWARINKASPRWQIAINIAMTAAMIWLVLPFPTYVAMSFLHVQIMNSYDGFLVVVVWDLIIGLLFGLVLGSRNTGRTLPSDIQNVETLGGSRGDAITGGIKGLVFGSIFGVVGSLLIGASKQWVIIIMVGLIGCLIGAFFDGLRSQVIAGVKIVPNQGIKLSMRNGIVYGGVVGLLSGLIFGTLAWVLVSKLNAGLQAGLKVWLTIWLMGFLWYGGLEVIRHYTLRLILYFKGYMPLDYARFLDYAAKRLVFLQKVGGGYEFIHRYLLEHFAELGTEEGSRVEESTP